MGLAAALLALPACGSGGDPCVTDIPGDPTSCSPLYPPTFDQIFSRTLQPTCAQPGAQCHSSAGIMGGLYFSTEDSAYALLLGQNGAPARVIPGNASCSTLVERLEATDSTELMPPGAKLSDAEICTIVQWIQQGAKR
jgi:Planctomycete cytochrome C